MANASTSIVKTEGTNALSLRVENLLKWSDSTIKKSQTY